MALNLTEANHAEVLANNSVVLIDFGATWCGPCKSIAPIIDELANEYDGKAAICKADIEECEELAMSYGIRSVPTLLFFKDGEIVPGKKIVGATPKAKLVEVLDELIG